MSVLKLNLLEMSWSFLLKNPVIKSAHGHTLRRWEQIRPRYAVLHKSFHLSPLFLLCDRLLLAFFKLFNMRILRSRNWPLRKAFLTFIVHWFWFFFSQTKHVMKYFEGFFRGADNFLTPKLSCAMWRAILGSKRSKPSWKTPRNVPLYLMPRTTKVSLALSESKVHWYFYVSKRERESESQSQRERES
jgi:hypothetical protein